MILLYIYNNNIINLLVSHNLNEKIDFETDPNRIYEKFELLSPQEKKLINSHAFNSNFFLGNSSIHSNSTQEFFKNKEKVTLNALNTKLQALTPKRIDVLIKIFILSIFYYNSKRKLF